jgi:hypothetical protein
MITLNVHDTVVLGAFCVLMLVIGGLAINIFSHHAGYRDGLAKGRQIHDAAELKEGIVYEVLFSQSGNTFMVIQGAGAEQVAVWSWGLDSLPMSGQEFVVYLDEQGFPQAELLKEECVPAATG